MLKNYFKVAWRNLRRSKLYSLINIAGLATGMAVAMLIGLWIYDEISFDRQDRANYDRIGQVWQNVSFGVEKGTYQVMPIPMAAELRAKYPDFKYVCLASEHLPLVLAAGDKMFTKTGSYVEPLFPEMLTLKMLVGNRNALSDVNSILLSQSVATAFFGKEDPMNRLMRISNLTVKVAGVYEDFPNNSSFNDLSFLASWELYAANDAFTRNSKSDWFNNSWNVYAQLKDGADFGVVSAKIKDILTKSKNPPPYKAEYFLWPMSRWHLYSDFTNGVNTGGMITNVWLFGIIGGFVLLLACINFMNLSTARSEKRAKEVGIRKAIGSVRRQLVIQFLSESLLVAVFAFVLSLALVELSLPFFNGLADKKMTVLWWSPLFWLAGIGFSLLTGVVAGSYPALYLSSFDPVKILKGTFKAGRFASVPRKVLVTMQFTVSVVLIIGTIVVYRQIQYAKDMTVGYNRNNLIEVNINTPALKGRYEVLRGELLNSGAVSAFSESSCSITGQNNGTTNLGWRGKGPNAHPLVMANHVTSEFGSAVGWNVIQGRDFSRRTAATDSSAMILNESAVKLMGLKDPIGEIVTRGQRPYTVIGVVKNMIRNFPFRKVEPAFYTVSPDMITTMQIRLAPGQSMTGALGKVAAVFRKYNPESPFDCQFVEQDYAKKFGSEQRIGGLASFFAVLAVFISCLGLFGLASFVAEQRTKEIGVRKVLGASVANVWGLLSKEFLWLVGISLVIAMPVAYYFMSRWLQNYEYHAALSWWIFAAAGCGALLITLVTVSFQAVRAAMASPVRSLRTE